MEKDRQTIIADIEQTLRLQEQVLRECEHSSVALSNGLAMFHRLNQKNQRLVAELLACDRKH